MSAWKPTVVAIMFIVLGGLVKAGMHFIRLALLAILGLLGMYLLHKLAQDWNKIRPGGGGGGGNRPRITSLLGMATRLFRSKRSVDPHTLMDTTNNFEDTISSKFSNILYFDPMGCARKFICYSSCKPASNLTQSENNLLQMFKTDPSESPKDHKAFKVFHDAAQLGKITKNVTLCEKAYRFCYLTNKQLHTIYAFL
ncbi:uncharacterized protein LOC135844596 [Planococcus citri]|uniref:uncharacterized protein LOC135844596 n=1 Tax=Planococcus citri TaxID=170843 RepID=UPI0031FA2EB6